MANCLSIYLPQKKCSVIENHENLQENYPHKNFQSVVNVDFVVPYFLVWSFCEDWLSLHSVFISVRFLPSIHPSLCTDWLSVSWLQPISLGKNLSVQSGARQQDQQTGGSDKVISPAGCMAKLSQLLDQHYTLTKRKCSHSKQFTHEFGASTARKNPHLREPRAALTAEFSFQLVCPHKLSFLVLLTHRWLFACDMLQVDYEAPKQICKMNSYSTAKCISCKISKCPDSLGCRF